MTTHLGLGPTLRTTKRARDILAVLVRYGFADLAEDLGMRRAWSFVRRLLHRPPMPDPGPEEVRIRRMLEELGPTFVKLGQVLSTRPDLVSETWCEEFRKLQSEAPSVPFEAMEVELRRELGSGSIRSWRRWTPNRSRPPRSRRCTERFARTASASSSRCCVQACGGPSKPTCG